MKKIFTLFILLALSTPALNAQNKDTKKADQLYDRLLYTDAAEAYQKLLKKGKGSRYVFNQLGNCYYYINDTKKAETYYKRVVRGRKLEAEVVYNYAQTLKANGKYGESNEWMQRFAEMKPDDSRAREFMKNPNYIPKMMDEVERFGAKNMEEVNSEFSDFGAFVMGKDFYFASSRNEKRKKHGLNEQPFLDIYKARDVGGTIKNAALLEGEINTKFHESNAVISPDGKRMYFDRNDYFNGKFAKNEEGVNQINLYYAELIDGEWKGVQGVSWNSHEYSIGHPALSQNGNMLYFVSDMPGGKGASDIYRVAINSDGSFGTPERLGDNINTEGREVFPYVDSAGNLYFSSDGHQGLGLLDVFVAEAEGNGFGPAMNMGKGMNSTADDFAVMYDPQTKTGFVSSDREGGKGSDDIYRVRELDIPCEITYNVTVLNEYTDGPIAGARVDLYDDQNNRLSTRTADADGRTVLQAECDKDHVVQAVLADFESAAVEVAAMSGKDEVDVVVRMRPIEEIIVGDRVVLNPIYFDYDKSNIKPQAAFELDKLVNIMQKYPRMKIKVESHTDSQGRDEYNLSLSERRAQSTVQYVISKGIDASRISGEGKGETEPKVDCGSNCTKEQHAQNRRSEFIIVER
jgi:outer membrane protein OmpA-like peptidoglycan-associated protein/tetratricopeptide (TPR) repeat protein